MGGNFVDLPSDVNLVTSVGTVAVAEAANTVLAGPTSGAAGLPTFRALVAADIPGGGGSGTVTSVALASSAPSLFNVSGSPVTTAGTITIQEVIQSSGTILAGPSSGADSKGPVFRALVGTDIPAIALANSGAGGVSGILPVANGGSSSGSFDLNGALLGNNQSAFKTVLPGSSGNVLMSNGIIWQSSPITGAAGGTVTSVDFASSSPSIFNVSGNPITTAGTITIQEIIQSSGTLFAGPSSGSLSKGPTFRALVSTDIPAINLASGGQGGVSGVLPVANGGSSTGALNLNAALLGNNQSALQQILPGSSGNVLISNGTTWQSSTIPVSGGGSGTVTSVAFSSSGPSIFNVSGSPITTSGTLTIQEVIQSSALVFAGPTSGAANPAAPTFRALVAKDLPIIQPTGGGNGSSSGFLSGAVLLGNDGAPYQTIVPGSSGNVLISNGSVWQASTIPVGNQGTVTSVAFASSTPSLFNVSGSPITTNGTITIQEVIQSSGTILAGPSSGSDSKGPTFRALVGTDIPAVNLASGGQGGVSGILPVANGGSSSGAFAANAVLLGNDGNAFGTVVPGSSGNYLRSNGTTWISVPTDAGGGGSGTVTSVDFASSSPSIFNVSGNPITTSGTLTLQEKIQSSALVFAGPTSGQANPAAPTFRSLVASDIPSTLDAMTLTGNTIVGQNNFYSFASTTNSTSFQTIGSVLLPTSTNVYFTIRVIGRQSSTGTPARAAYFRSIMCFRDSTTASLASQALGIASHESNANYDFTIASSGNNIVFRAHGDTVSPQTVRWAGVAEYVQVSS